MSKKRIILEKEHTVEFAREGKSQQPQAPDDLVKSFAAIGVATSVCLVLGVVAMIVALIVSALTGG